MTRDAREHRSPAGFTDSDYKWAGALVLFALVGLAGLLLLLVQAARWWLGR